MAGPWYVDDGGDGTTEDSWATADTSLKDLDAEKTFASGEIVYFGHDHVCQATHSANLTVTGPASGAPVSFISATQGSSPVTYAASTTAQVDTTEGAYDIVFDGSFALYGLSCVSGRDVVFSPDDNESLYSADCRFSIAAGRYFQVLSGYCNFDNITIDFTQDGTTNRGTTPLTFNIVSRVEINGLSFINPGYRTGSIIYIYTADVSISGADFSGFTNGTECEICAGADMGAQGTLIINNSLTKANFVPIAANISRNGGTVMMTNVGPEDSPTYMFHASYKGQTVSSTAIYRSTGATIEGINVGWLVTTTANANEGNTYKTPWIYGEITTTGSKTFDIYITNDTADFTDAEVWLEVEYLATADEAQSTIVSDHRTITDAAAAQTDDTTSTWTGTGPSFTYKQKLSRTATVGETGMYRARVSVGVASIASSRYFYIDPKVTVS